MNRYENQIDPAAQEADKLDMNINQGDNMKNFKNEVLRYAKRHNMKEAADKYDIPYTTVRSWKITKDKKRKRRPLKDNVHEVLNYVNLHGIKNTADKYGVTEFAVQYWINKTKQSSGSINNDSENNYTYTLRKKSTPNKLKGKVFEVLEHVFVYGIKDASEKYEVHENTIHNHLYKFKKLILLYEQYKNNSNQELLFDLFESEPVENELIENNSVIDPETSIKNYQQEDKLREFFKLFKELNNEID